MVTLLKLLLFFCMPFAENGNGIVTGRVVDAQSKEVLPGVNIIVSGTLRGAASDYEGRFEIAGLEPGIYNIEFSYLGYQSIVLSDVVVRNHRPAILETELRPGEIEGEEIVIRTSFFIKDESAPVSRISLNTEEIRRSPGSGQELSRVIMASPGIATHGDMSQDLLVRGGSPSENGFYIDHIPVPGINHFERQNSRSSGPIGIVNTDLVEQLDFYSGGFSSAFGNHASSVANIRYRQGSREKFHSDIMMSMAGFGITLENPIANGKGSILFSARRSYLDLIANAINAGGAPRYGDIQFKGVYDIDGANRITVLNIYGNSLFKSDHETAVENGMDRYTSALTFQNTTGINWRRLWSNSFYSNISLSHSFKQDDTQLLYVEDHSTDINFDILRNFTTIRNTNYVHIDSRNRLEFGIQADYQTGNFDYYHGPTVNPAGVERPEFQRKLNLTEILAGAFVTWMTRPVEKLALSIGSRTDYNTLNNRVTLSPRGGLSYKLTDKWTANASAGIYRQTMPLFFRSQNPEFEKLRDFRSDQYIIGLDWQLTPETMITIEAYEKQYHQLPALAINHGLGFEVFVLETEMFFDALRDNGRSYARGIDVMLQKKLARNFYGMASSSIFRTEFRDSEGNWQSRIFDVNNIFNIVGGYRPNNRYYFSVRWSYIGGRPITPIDVVASRESGTTILDFSRFNQSRMPAYHSLFFRFDRRWYLNTLTMTLFLEMWNAYNRSNVEAYYWNAIEERVETFNQFSTIPIGGFRIEF